MSAKNRVALLCAGCQAPIERPMSALKKSKHGRYYCSNQCRIAGVGPLISQAMQGHPSCRENGLKNYHHIRKYSGEGNAYRSHGLTVGRAAYRKLRKSQCQRCEGIRQLGVHHKNNDHYDNRPENLETLCNSCHMRELMHARNAAKRAGMPYQKSNGPVGWRHEK